MDGACGDDGGVGAGMNVLRVPATIPDAPVEGPPEPAAVEGVPV